MSQQWTQGSTRAWRKLRTYIGNRDGDRCRAHDDGWCDPIPGHHECRRRYEHAHHVYGRAHTGDDPRYIVTSCAPCNHHIGEPKPPPPEPKRVSRW